MQAYSLLSEPPGKPKNTRVGSLSLSPGDLPYPGVPCIESEVMKSLSHVQLFAIPWTVVYQASLSMGFSRQEYWSGLPFPSPGDLPDPGIEPGSPALQADAEGNLVTIKEPLPVPLPPSSRKTLKCSPSLCFFKLAFLLLLSCKS